jgi:hypothetical protein
VADAEKRAAGATVESKTSELLFNFAWWMKKREYAEATIQGRVKLLKRLIRLSAELRARSLFNILQTVRGCHHPLPVFFPLLTRSNFVEIFISFNLF